MNPWESLAVGIDIERVASKGRAIRNRKWRTKVQMQAHGVTTVAALREKQIMRDNTKPGGFNFPVGKGYVYGTIEGAQ